MLHIYFFIHHYNICIGNYKMSGQEKKYNKQDKKNKNLCLSFEIIYKILQYCDQCLFNKRFLLNKHFYGHFINSKITYANFIKQTQNKIKNLESVNNSIVYDVIDNIIITTIKQCGGVNEKKLIITELCVLFEICCFYFEKLFYKNNKINIYTLKSRVVILLNLPNLTTNYLKNWFNKTRDKNLKKYFECYNDECNNKHNDKHNDKHNNENKQYYICINNYLIMLLLLYRGILNNFDKIKKHRIFTYNDITKITHNITVYSKFIKKFMCNIENNTYNKDKITHTINHINDVTTHLNVCQ